MSNLCLEVTNFTKPLTDINDESGEIALCILSSINIGKIKKPGDFERLCNLVVRSLDELIDYQDYPVKAAKISTYNRRPIGIGITNLAYFLAKNDLTYQNITNDGLAKIHEYMEAFSYYIIKSSVELAKEKGACPKSNETKYSLGIMPIDTYKREIDELVEPIYKMDWNSLRADAIKYGIRNSTLMAQMPNESSSQTNNSTNGIEPPRSLVSIKQSKDGVLKQVVPEIRRLKNKYDLLWNQKSPIGYLKICAVIQKFIDQAISVNTSYNPNYYENNEIPMSEMLQHLLLSYKWGNKNLYYCNSLDSAGEIDINQSEIKQEENIIENDELCEACSI
jgi:ribonucleoside-diphosphate reductase alpha chain